MSDGKLTYNDFMQRLDIQDVLLDAGYQLNKRDGLRYPSYVRTDSDGRRVRGDKFIVTQNGKCCFQPPEQKVYNVISFIKEHPYLFADHKAGMSPDRLVNLVCNRLLNQPSTERTDFRGFKDIEPKVFNIEDYTLQGFRNGDWDSQKPFYPYFKARGIDIQTQRTFSDHFYLATKQRNDGKNYTNLAFPLSLPSWPGRSIVGLEERSRPNAEGKCLYKGLATGSNAAQGLWIARLENHRSDNGYSKPLSQVNKVYWFESAYDAMAYYQLHRDKKGIGDAVFVSTSGNPSNGQFDGMAKETASAQHILCFDADEAGEKFARAFYTRHPELNIVREYPEGQYKDWNEVLMGGLSPDSLSPPLSQGEGANEQASGQWRR